MRKHVPFQHHTEACQNMQMQQQSNFFLLDIFKQRKIHEIGLASARMTKQGTQFGHVLDPLCKMVYFRDAEE